MLLEALQQLELTAEVVVVVARCEILVHPLASQLRVEWVDEDRWLCAAAHHHRLELSHLSYGLSGPPARRAAMFRVGGSEQVRDHNQRNHGLKPGRRAN